MNLQVKNPLRTAIATLLLAGSYQVQATSAASFDSTTNTLNIPVVDVRSGHNTSTYSAQLKLKDNGQLELLRAVPTGSVTGTRATFFGDSNVIHLPSLKVTGSNTEYYAKLKLIQGSNPLAFTLEQLNPTTFSKCPDFASDGPVAGTCVINGSTEGISHDITLTSDIDWILSGGVYIGGDNINSATITINPGTNIIGQKGADFLYIRRGSKIIAEGTPDSPIIMTGPTEQSPGEWGGLLLAGNAPVNGCAKGVNPCETAFEAITTEKFGGNQANDSSGVLKYVQVKYAGFEVRPNEELNGISMLGVGSGTVVDYVQVHAGLDDGIEMFGGTVQMKHLVLTSNSDDSLDWGSGWTGKAQYVVIKQALDDGDRGIEADNNPDNNDALPRSKPRLANFTALGSDFGNQGILLRRGTGVELYNSVFTGFGSSCLKLDGAVTYTNAGSPSHLTGEIKIENTYMNCLQNFSDGKGSTFKTVDLFNAQSGNVAGDPVLRGIFPMPSSPLLKTTVDSSLNDSFFDKTNYIGAFKDANDNWVAEWTVNLQ